MVYDHNVYASRIQNNLPHSCREREQGKGKHEDDGFERFSLLGILVYLPYNHKHFNHYTYMVSYAHQHYFEVLNLDHLCCSLALWIVTFRLDLCHLKPLFKSSHCSDHIISCLLWLTSASFTSHERGHYQAQHPNVVKSFTSYCPLLNNLSDRKV